MYVVVTAVEVLRGLAGGRNEDVCNISQCGIVSNVRLVLESCSISV